VSALGPVDCLRENKRTHLTALILKAFSFGQSTGYHAVTWLQAEALRLGLESGARVLDLHPLPVRHHLPRHPRYLVCWPKPEVIHRSLAEARAY